MTATNPNEGDYYPNKPGAQTLAEARAMMAGDRRVSATVWPSGEWTPYFGTEPVVRGVLDGTEGPLMTYFQAEAMTAMADAEDKYDDAVQAVRAEGRRYAAEAQKLSDGNAAHGDRYHRTPASLLDQMAYLRRTAAVPEEWTSVNERGYKQYISDGLADTDGSFYPLDRAAWKVWNG